MIPRKELAEIYAEMLVTDQWIVSVPGIRLIADTSLVYEPILEKYGYDSDDYRKSVDAYMDDPERFARILRTSAEILEEKILELEHKQILLELRAKLPKLEYSIDFSKYFPYMFDEPYVVNCDSVSFEVDSALWIYRLKSIEMADTVMTSDSLPPVDTLAVADSIEEGAMRKFVSPLKVKRDLKGLMDEPISYKTDISLDKE